MKHILLSAALVVVIAPAASAGMIERACLSSDRAAASRTLCGCIQRAADSTLTMADQRLASRFFGDPNMVQNIRMSKRSDHSSFWERYKTFGARAEAYCG